MKGGLGRTLCGVGPVGVGVVNFENLDSWMGCLVIYKWDGKETLHSTVYVEFVFRMYISQNLVGGFPTDALIIKISLRKNPLIARHESCTRSWKR